MKVSADGPNSTKEEDKIKAIIPWGNPSFLSVVMEERVKEKAEALSIVENLVEPEILPEDIKPIVKKPDKKELIEEMDD